MLQSTLKRDDFINIHSNWFWYDAAPLISPLTEKQEETPVAFMSENNEWRKSTITEVYFSSKKSAITEDMHVYDTSERISYFIMIFWQCIPSGTIC